VSLRTLGPEFDPDVVAQIDERLRGAERDEQAKILLAVESGSRAWGFPSPDSDYDCRFIYVRPRDAYLTLFPRRDVIETAHDAVLDINGWDLAKALRLMLKGNAVVIEWLTSPHAYAGDPRFREEFLALARQAADRDALARHYLHLGERQRRTYFENTRAIQLKKIFYALRPAVALRWLRLHADETVPPMHFPTLVAESDLPGDVRDIITDLMARKAVTRELGRGTLPKPLGALIDAEFALARDSERLPEPSTRNKAAADDFFRHWVMRYAGHSLEACG
jgi:uncharacterized protein